MLSEQMTKEFWLEVQCKDDDGSLSSHLSFFFVDNVEQAIDCAKLFVTPEHYQVYLYDGPPGEGAVRYRWHCEKGVVDPPFPIEDY